MNQDYKKNKICIIGGAGHIGLPLGIFFANKGLDTMLVDINKKLFSSIQKGNFPYKEENAKQELSHALKSNHLLFSKDDKEAISCSEFIFLVISFTFFYGCNSEKSTKISVVRNITVHPLGSVIKIDGLGLLKLQKLDKKIYIINVSKPNSNERQCKQVKNYHHLEAAKIYKNPNLLPKNKTLILISREGKESLKLANYLKNLGITVYNLTGGLKAYFEWKNFIETQHKLKPINDKIFDELEETDFGC